MKKKKKKKNAYKNDEFKISTLTSNEEFELTYGLYSVIDIHDYVKYILKNTRQLLIIFQ